MPSARLKSAGFAPGCAGMIDPTSAGVAPFGTGDDALAADHEAGKERLAVADRAAVDLLDRRRLRGRETVGRIGALAAGRHVARRIEAALARIVDQAVLEAVHLVALRHHLLGDELHLRREHRRFADRLLIPHRADRESGLIDPRRVGDDAVEVVGVALRLEQALPAAVGAGVPVRERDRLGVVVLGDLLGRSRP